MSSAPYTIGEVAKAAGVPTSTVRYYERRGLLLPDSRTRSRYRSYGDAALQRLRFIRSHQRCGLTLDNISEILDLAEGRSGPREAVQRLIARRLEEVDRTLRELRQARPLLCASLELCEQAARQGSARVACPGRTVPTKTSRQARA